MTSSGQDFGALLGCVPQGGQPAFFRDIIICLSTSILIKAFVFCPHLENRQSLFCFPYQCNCVPWLAHFLVSFFLPFPNVSMPLSQCHRRPHTHFLTPPLPLLQIGGRRKIPPSSIRTSRVQRKPPRESSVTKIRLSESDQSHQFSLTIALWTAPNPLDLKQNN